MSYLSERETSSEAASPAILRALLVDCHLDLDIAGRGMCGGDGMARPLSGSGADGADGADQPLARVAERLERVVGGLDAILSQAGNLMAGPADLLAREADHRIKNSLQTVVATLFQQARTAGTDAERNALESAAARVAALAEVHASLSFADGVDFLFPEIDLGAHLTSLIGRLTKALGTEEGPLAVRVEVERLAVSPDMAKQLGLVVTELVTNALRHAFPAGRKGVVRVIGARRRDGCYQVCVIDDGRGLPPGSTCGSGNPA